MVDHLEMRSAYLRAMFNSPTPYCNNCKDPYLKDTGETIDIVTQFNVYKIWECQLCTDERMEFFDDY